MSDKSPPAERKKLPVETQLKVLTEAGYRCAVPTCRGILALDMHHIFEVSEGGGDDPSNLIALCPTCHALYHRGTIKRESVYVWKSTLVTLNRAFDAQAIDDLLFLDVLSGPDGPILLLSGDGVVKFSRLVGAGLVEISGHFSTTISYRVDLSKKGATVVKAWKSGDREAMKSALYPTADDAGLMND